MIDKSQVSCNCFGITNPNQQKFFLARKRQQEECQTPQSARRVVKSSEVKNEIEGKGQKKSLKKRPGSFVHSDNVHSASNEPNKMEKEIKANLLQEPTLKSKHSWSKEAEIATLSCSNPLVLKFPQTTISAKQPILNSNPKQFIRNKSGPTNFIQYNPIAYGYHQNQKNNFHLRPQLLQFQNQTTHNNYKPPNVINEKIAVDIFKQVDSRTLIPPHQIIQNQFQTHSIPLLSQNNIRLQTENFTPPSEDPLLIKDFQKLFRNKEDNTCNKQLTRDKNTIKPRDAIQSKRFHQQHLMGRLVESQDEDCSESLPSEVIGKGFDRSYQDFFDQNEPVIIQQTKESRSTNTKVSNLRGQKQVDQHLRTKFGNLTHFTSYERI